MSVIIENICPFSFSNKSEFSYAFEIAVFLTTYPDLAFSKGLDFFKKICDSYCIIQPDIVPFHFLCCGKKHEAQNIQF